jgi:hypothetical protein
MALRLGKSLILLGEKLVKLACLVKLAFTHHEERVVGGPTDSSASMPPTSHIVKNLAEELRGKEVGKNWVGQFVKRYRIRLKSLYLRNINNLLASAEYAPMFQLFFSVVS